MPTVELVTVDAWRVVIKETRSTPGSGYTSTRSSGASGMRAGSRYTESRPSGR
jgi:hypothetical protein